MVISYKHEGEMEVLRNELSPEMRVWFEIKNFVDNDWKNIYNINVAFSAIKIKCERSFFNVYDKF